MTDLEMTKLCAEAMGLRLLPAYPKGHLLHKPEHDRDGLMYSIDGNHYFIDSGAYVPLTNDEQALALVKKFQLQVGRVGTSDWHVKRYLGGPLAAHYDLNRAIVACVAKMQASDSTTASLK